MTSKELRQKFLDFMAEKGHAVIPSSSLVPKEDPTVLFINSGMQPLVPYLMGLQEHPQGNRLADSQKCLRTGDIEEVGDNRHLTFFEMLGNWSVGDYFKQEAIEWSFEFMTSEKWLGLDPKRIYATTFKGSNNAPEDTESVRIWQEVFAANNIKADAGEEYDFDNPTNNPADRKYCYRITQMSAEENWWGLPHRGPCGGDTEIFYLREEYPVDYIEKEVPQMSPQEAHDFLENNLIEIWNNVFMEYEGEPDADGYPQNLSPLKQKNVDTGMGLERIVAFLNGKENVFETDLLKPLVDVVEKWRG